MIPIKHMWCAHIDITYYCGRKCVYCTRNDRHLGDKRYHLSLPAVEQALVSYGGFPGLIGIMGGEPLAHPQFKEVCEIIRNYYPPSKMHLWTSIEPATSKYKTDISKTFQHVAYHPHTPEQEAGFYHQPSTLASKDMVVDLNLRAALIDDCWLQRKWCPAVTIDGAFFCEVAGSIARISGKQGWPVESGWWKRMPPYTDQIDLCELCGICVPMERQKMSDKKQKISPSFLKLLQDTGRPIGEYELVTEPMTVAQMKAALPNWTPSCYKEGQLGEVFPHSTIDWSKYS